MQRARTKTLTAIGSFISFALWNPIAVAQPTPIPIGTEITFQGQLELAGAPLNDTADFQFTLWNLEGSGMPPTGGSRIGSQIDVNNVDVVDGLFTVELDFGPEPFTDESRWLQIAVRSPAGAGTFTTLSPRQHLTASFYSLATRGLVVDPDGNVGMGIDTPAAKLHVLGKLKVGNSIEIGGATGLLDTIEATGGTIDFVDDNLITTGKIGVGLPGGTIPSYPIHVFTGDQRGIHANTSHNFGRAIMGEATDTATINETYGIWGQSKSFNGRGVLGLASTTSGPSTTGIGGGTRNYGGFFESAGSQGCAVFGEASNTDGNGSYGGFFRSHGLTGYGVYGVAANVQGGVTHGGFFKSFGIDGIGAYAEGAQYGISARSTGIAGYLLAENTSQASPPTVARFEAIQQGGGVFDSHFAMDFTGNSINAYDIEDGGTGASIRLNGSSSGDVSLVGGGGNVSIDAGVAEGKLHVVVDDVGINVTNFTEPFERDVIIEDPNAAWLTLYSDEGGGINSGISFIERNPDANNKWAIYRRTSGNVGDLNFTYGENSNPGANTKMMQIFTDGRTRVQVLEITGADVAERFPISDSVEPGMVVEIDPTRTGNLRRASGAYNRRVAGVVSGAGDLPVGAILGNLTDQDDGPPIALSGRVWVYCDATSHAIEPGDLLTTADRPGHAMKVTEHGRATGATIGKAMSKLAKGECGLVLVLVNLQ